jgi:hypothetical protein
MYKHIDYLCVECFPSHDSHFDFHFVWIMQYNEKGV